MESLTIFKVGNGTRVSFWKDPWFCGATLKNRFPRLFVIAVNVIGAVSSHWDVSTSFWNIIFERLLKDEEVVEFHVILSRIIFSHVLQRLTIIERTAKAQRN